MGNTITGSGPQKKFNSQELSILKNFYQDIARRNGKTVIDKDVFLRVFNLPGIMGERLFEAFDSKRDDKVDFREFVNALAVVIHGTKHEKIRFLFNMYDFNSDGYVCRADLSTMLYCVAFGGHNYISHGEESATEKSFSENEHFEYKNYVEEHLRLAFPDKTGVKGEDQKLDFKEFEDFITRNNHLLQILEDAFIFEEISSNEEQSISNDERIARSCSRRYELGAVRPMVKCNSPPSLNRSQFQRMKCLLGDIITPDAVKTRHIKQYQNTPKICECKGICTTIENSEEKDYDAVENALSQAFEHMHHIHHDSNYNGYVIKFSRNFQFPLRRYLVLHDSFLYIFRKKSSRSPISTVWMKDCTIKQMNFDSHFNKNRWGFELSFPLNDKFKKKFYAPTEIIRNKWVKVLQESSERKNFNQLYEIGPKIGDGKFSLVYSCEKISSKRKYAVKLINRTGMKKFERESLRLELRTLKMLHHPNILHVRDVFEEKNIVYIVMQLFKGGDLLDRIIQKKRYNESDAKSVMHHLLDAVSHIHRLGIAHRDLKPENIMLKKVDDDINIAVADFGLSGFVGPEPVLHLPCGTLSYAAPELLLNEGYGKKVDIWSIGVIMYVLLGGNLPYNGRSRKEIITQIMTINFRFIGAHWKEISSDAKDLIAALLNTDPLKRISAEEAMQHEWFKE